MLLLLASPVASPVVGVTSPLVTPAVPSPLSAAVAAETLDVSPAVLVGAPEDEDDVVAGTAVADPPSPAPEHAASSDARSHVSLPVGREREIITGARISAMLPTINDRLYYSDTYGSDGVRLWYIGPPIEGSAHTQRVPRAACRVEVSAGAVCSDKPFIRAGAVRCCRR